MKYCQKLTTLIYRGQIIALDIAHGLRYLHEAKILHLDMKSPNVLISEDFTAKISDVVSPS